MGSKIFLRKILLSTLLPIIFDILHYRFIQDWLTSLGSIMLSNWGYNQGILFIDKSSWSFSLKNF